MLFVHDNVLYVKYSRLSACISIRVRSNLFACSLASVTSCAEHMKASTYRHTCTWILWLCVCDMSKPHTHTHYQLSRVLTCHRHIHKHTTMCVCVCVCDM